MSTVQTANATHNAKVVTLEAVRQAAVAVNSTPAAVLSANVTFHRAAALSAIANNCGVEPFMTALRSHGATLYP